MRSADFRNLGVVSCNLLGIVANINLILANLILIAFSGINYLLFPWDHQKSIDGNRSELIRGGIEVNHQLEWKLIRLNSLNNRSEVWRRYLKDQAIPGNTITSVVYEMIFDNDVQQLTSSNSETRSLNFTITLIRLKGLSNFYDLF